MQEKRYQVFISSTYEDLKEERQRAVNAVLQLDCFPACMEMFPAANEDAWTFIQKVIDDCDYYIVIIGGRYGSVASDGLSYTEKEYRYAMDKGKPVLALLHKNPGSINADKTEDSDEGKAKLAEFRKLVENQRMCTKWTNPESISAAVLASLLQLMKTCPGIGWVRGNSLTNQDELVSENIKLRKQNDELQIKLNETACKLPKGTLKTDNLAQGNDLYSFEIDWEESEGIYDGEEWYRPRKTSHKLSWNEIFSICLPMLANETHTEALTKAICEYVNSKGQLGMTEATIADRYMSRIIIQLKALGLIKKSETQRQLDDMLPFWMLTPNGEDMLINLLAVRKGEC